MADAAALVQERVKLSRTSRHVIRRQSSWAIGNELGHVVFQIHLLGTWTEYFVSVGSPDTKCQGAPTKDKRDTTERYDHHERRITREDVSVNES